MSQTDLEAREIFQAAMDCQSPESLVVFLEKACDGKADVRQRVGELLRAYQQAGNFLGGSAACDATWNSADPASLPCKNIGTYKLLQQIGEGGMGTVYMAEQTEPIQRKVALKLVKSGMDNRQAAARFEAERQALALMDHQNIAKVLDAGTTDTGQPYFVMELVHGLPITKYCDQQRLSPRERLELFIPVCQAVQHAHQKGIIHRDLKPNNILVANYDGQPVPKVIDFGVAKALGQKLTDKTMFTEFGSIVGTLEYMSPEQAEQSQLDVDTRADIYSLGVILYELLTGTTPLDRQRLKGAAILELLRIIKEEEPQKPSTRLSTTDALPSIAANRSLEPKKLSGLLRGELDWIVMKALDKDRNRRYETANGFAVDLQRYLHDEPVAACPPSAGYRLRKLIRRNKSLVAGICAVMVVLLVGTVTSTLLAFRAMTAERLADNRLITETKARNGESEARRQAETERDKAFAAEQRVASERDRAEFGFAQARATVEKYLTQVSENQLLTAPGLQPLRRELLLLALHYYEDFVKQRGDDPTVRAELAAAQLRMDHLYRELGLNQDANESRNRARTLYEALLQTDPDDPEFQFGLARTLAGMNELPKAITILESLAKAHPERNDFLHQLADNYNTVAVSQIKRQELSERLRLHQLALAVQERLVQKFPEKLEYRSALGMTLNNIGTLLSATNQLPAKLDMYRRAVEQQEIVYANSPQAIFPGVSLSISYSNIASCQDAAGDSALAETSYQRSVAILRKLAIENPAVAWIQVRYGMAVVNFARWQHNQGKEEEFQRQMLVFQQILSRLPRESALDQYNLACFHALYSAAIAADESTPPDIAQKESRQEADRAIEALQQAVANGYSDLQLLRTDKDLDSLRSRDDFQAVVQQVEQVATIAKLTKATPGQSADERLQAQTRLLEIRREQLAKAPQNIRAQADLALNHYAIGVIQSDLKQWEEAATSLAEARRLREELIRLDSESLQYQFDLAATLGKQSEVAERQGQSQAAADIWNRQRQLLKSLHDQKPLDPGATIALGEAWYARGYSLWAVQRHASALPCWDEGYRLLDRGRQELPEEPTLKRTLASKEFGLGNFLGSQGYFSLAVKHWENSRTIEHYLSFNWDARFAIVAAWAGDIEEYQAICRALVEESAGKDPRDIAWACSIHPDSSIAPDRILELAQEGVARVSDEKSSWELANLSRAKYRAGQFEQPQGSAGPFLTAMIEWQQGQQDSARKTLLAAEKDYAILAQTTLRSMSDRNFTPLYGQRIWWEELSKRLMRKEAWELIEGRVPPQTFQLLVDTLLWIRVGNQAEASKTLQAALADAPRNSAVDLYNLACFHALRAAAIVEGEQTPAPDALQVSQQEADRAIQTLELAVINGFRTARLLSTDKSLDVLRQRGDFQLLQSQVEQSLQLAELTKSNPNATPAERLQTQIQALKIRRELATKDPANILSRFVLASHLHVIGLLQSELKQWEPAAASFAEAQKLRSQLVQQDAQNIRYQSDLAMTLGQVSAIAEQLGQLPAATDAWNEQRQILESLHRRQPNDPMAVTALASGWYARGFALWGANQYASALPHWDEGHQILSRERQRQPDDPALKRAAARQEFELADFLAKHGYLQLAANHWALSRAAERYLSSEWESRMAAITAWAEPREQYQQLCRMLVDTFTETAPFHVASACTLMPDCSVPPERVLAIAEEAVKRDGDREASWIQATLSRAQVLAGKSADASLTSSRFLNALIQWNRGDQKLARQTLLDAEEQFIELVTATLGNMHNGPALPIHGRDYWTLIRDRIARREAWALIEGKVPVLTAESLIDSLLWTRVGNQAEADKSLQTALEGIPTQPQALATFAATMTDLGHAGFALAAYNVAVEKHPEMIEHRLARGHYHLQCGNHAAADADFSYAATLTPEELNKFIEPGWWVSANPPDASGWITPAKAATTATGKSSPSEPASVLAAWHFVRPSMWEGEFKLRSAPGLNAATTVYGLAYVYSPEAKAVTLLVGGYTPLDLRLNGRLIYRWKAYSTHYNLDRVPVLLQPGRNTLVIQLTGPVEDKGVIFRIGDTPLDRGLELAYLGDWDRALPLLKTAFAEDQQRDRGANSWQFYAKALLQSGDMTGYQDLRVQALDWAPKRNTADTLLQVSSLCSLAPLPEDQAARVVQLVDDGIAKASSYKASWMTDNQTIVYYRAGRYQDVLDRVGTRGGPQWSALRALCHHRLGNAERAKTELNQSISQRRSMFTTGPDGVSSARASVYRHGILDTTTDFSLISEARALIAPDGPADDVAVETWRAAVRQQLDAANPRLLPFEMSLIYDGKNPHRWLERGRAFAVLGDWDRAAADFTKAVSMAPADPEVLAARIRAYADLQRIDEAAADVLKLRDDKSELAKSANWPEVCEQLESDLTQWPALAERLKPTPASQ